jgi:hypothetical protein
VGTGWRDVSITATSIVVDGTELAHNLNGVDPRDPDREHSFYVDASGGKIRLVCSRWTFSGPSLDWLRWLSWIPPALRRATSTTW